MMKRKTEIVTRIGPLLCMYLSTLYTGKERSKKVNDIKEVSSGYEITYNKNTNVL